MRLEAEPNPLRIDRVLSAARDNAIRLATTGHPDDSGFAIAGTEIPSAGTNVDVETGSAAGTGIPRTAGTGIPSGSATPPICFPGYLIIREIHRGGQGIVFQAVRESTGEDVAIKVLNDRRAASPRELERFEREAEILRELNHPNLIAVSEIGVTDGESGRGRPFLVMPYIAGWPLDEHVRRNGLSVRETLELFAKICEAVNAAHLNGVIHRDLKPSNIRIDDAGDPHVLDFGLAKVAVTHVAPVSNRRDQVAAGVPAGRSGGDARIDAGTGIPSGSQAAGAGLPNAGSGFQNAGTGIPSGSPNAGTGIPSRSLTESLTETGQFVGSLPWASPEQADPSLGRVDVRTDVYSLGAVLYQLLTGVLPINPIGSQREVLNRIVSADPVPLLSVGQRSALHYGIDSDVDTLVMKCLSKDRARRYSSAGELAADIRRYLAGRPIEARRDSALYMLINTLRRYRIPVTIAAAFMLLILCGSVVVTVLWRQAAVARDAESEQRARAGAINTFLKDMLTAAEPAKAKGEKFTVREALDTAARGIEERPLSDQPLVEAEIRFTIGSTYLALGLFSQAEAQLRAAAALQSRELGDEHRDTLRTRSKLAETLASNGDYAGTATLAQATLETQRRAFGTDDADTLKTMAILGNALWAQPGRFAESESLLRAAIEGLQRVRGKDHPETADAMNYLGELYAHNTYTEKAEQLHCEALRIHTQFHGAEHPSTLDSMNFLAVTLGDQGHPEEAETMLRQALEASLRVCGPDHMSTLRIQASLANALNQQGRHSDAESIHRESVAGLLRTVGPAHLNTIMEQRFLARCLMRLQKHPQAETLLREALAAALAKYGPEEVDTSIPLMCALARVLATQRKDAEAEQVARHVLEVQRRQLPRPDLSELHDSSLTLIEVLQRRGAGDEALQVGQELLRFLSAAAHEPDASAKVLNRAAQALLYPVIRQLFDAPQALELALQANQRSERPNPRYLRTLAQAYLLTGDPARATQAWEQASTLLADDQRRAEMLNGAAWELLTVTPENLRNPTAALQLARKANELSHYENPSQLDTLALACHRTGDTAQAIELQKNALSLLAADAQSRPEHEKQLAEFERALQTQPKRDEP